MSSQRSVVVHANSQFHGVFGNKSSMRVTVPGGQLRAPPPMQMFATLVSAQIPNCQYHINEQNNKIDYVLGGAEDSVTIETGNYTVTQLVDHLRSKFGAASIAPFAAGSDASYGITYNSLKNKLTFAQSGNVGFRFASGSNAGQSAYSVLGFREKADVAAAASVTSTGLVDVSGGQNIYNIRSDLLSTNSIGPGGQSDILDSIPIMGPANALTQYQPVKPFRCLIPHEFITEFDLRLTDTASEALIDLQGKDWTAAVLFEFERPAQSDIKDPRKLMQASSPSEEELAAMNEKQLQEMKEEELRQVALAQMEGLAATEFRADAVGGMGLQPLMGLEEVARQTGKEIIGQFGGGAQARERTMPSFQDAPYDAVEQPQQ